MAGFFDFMGKMVAGKPVFDESNGKQEAKSDGAPTSAASGPVIEKNRDHTFPVVHVRRVKTHLNGNTMQIYCSIQNTWQQEVMLDKIRLLGTKRELDTVLRAGEEREFLVYSGPKLTKEHHEAELDYKTQIEGDYFQAVHEVSFTYHPDDKTYSVNNMELRHPIRDIYE